MRPRWSRRTIAPRWPAKIDGVSTRTRAARVRRASSCGVALCVATIVKRPEAAALKPTRNVPVPFGPGSSFTRFVRTALPPRLKRTRIVCPSTNGFTVPRTRQVSPLSCSLVLPSRIAFSTFRPAVPRAGAGAGAGWASGPEGRSGVGVGIGVWATAAGATASVTTRALRRERTITRPGSTAQEEDA